MSQRELEQELILHTIMYMERQDQQNITARKIPTHGLSDGAERGGKKIVVSVLVEGGDSGGRVAAPIADKVFHAFLD